MRQCTKCRQLKPLIEFHKNKLGKGGLHCWCKECRKRYSQVHKVKAIEYRKKYYQTHKIEYAERGKKYSQTEEGKLYRRKQLLRNCYGLTLEQYDEMFENQNGVCAICGGTNVNGRRLCVDHDHETEKIRALLCNYCNNLLGHAKENIVILQSTINYLKKYKT